MTSYTYELKIPKDRVAVLIGKGGETKKEIEDSTHCRLDIDSGEGDVIITGEDGLGLFSAKEVVKAIARGFNPEVAILLLGPNYSFEMLNITDYVGKSKDKMLRLKGRVIGTEGKTRRIIEEHTSTHITVYGKTVGIIGTIEDVLIAKKAIESLLEGAPHSSIYTWLEKKRRSRVLERLEPIEFKEGIKEEFKKDIKR